MAIKKEIKISISILIIIIYNLKTSIIRITFLYFIKFIYTILPFNKNFKFTIVSISITIINPI